MGRPAGTMERKFSVEEVQCVAGRCQVPAARLDVLMSDARALFGNAAGEKVTITRRMVCESLWLMRELVQESPVQIVHVDSILSLSLMSVAYVFGKVHAVLFIFHAAAFYFDCKDLCIYNVCLRFTCPQDWSGTIYDLPRVHPQH